MAMHLLLRLSSPLVAFGGEAIDSRGVIREFPAQSMVTGLLANALGWDRTEYPKLQALQDHLIVGVRHDSEAATLTDFQTAQLEHDDRAWTTLGTPEERAGGKASYESPHLRYRDYWANCQIVVALRVREDADLPDLKSIADALDRPARPLFIGRKPCLPMNRLVIGWVDANSVLDALLSVTWPHGVETVRAQWPIGEGSVERMQVIEVCDERRWRNDVHGGWRQVCQGTLRLPVSVE